MAAIANLSINNYAVTPVTYTALGVSNGVARWADVSQGTLAGYREIFLTVKHPKDPVNGVIRVQGKCVRPVIDGTTGALSYKTLGTYEFVIPVKASLAERQEIWAVTKNSMLSSTPLQNGVLQGEIPW